MSRSSSKHRYNVANARFSPEALELLIDEVEGDCDEETQETARHKTEAHMNVLDDCDMDILP